MSEGSTIESLDVTGYVDFQAAGEPAVGEFHCSECGYGVVVQRVLPSCPMCGGGAWEASTWSPFSRAGDRRLR
jgi:rubrerythrin